MNEKEDVEGCTLVVNIFFITAHVQYSNQHLCHCKYMIKYTNYRYRRWHKTHNRTQLYWRQTGES